jgi:DNA-binding transcriptional LysR family regulator
LLALLPLPDNPIERDWYVMHVSDKRLPHVASLFRDFLVEQGTKGSVPIPMPAVTAARKRRRA